MSAPELDRRSKPATMPPLLPGDLEIDLSGLTDEALDRLHPALSRRVDEPALNDLIDNLKENS